MQENWIGKSNGLAFDLYFDEDSKEKLGHKFERFDVFTTRPDTIYGVSYTALAPEHKIVTYMIEQKLLSDDVIAQINAMKNASSIDRQKEKLGLPLGLSVVHPLTGKTIPVWIANFVLMDYGSGAVMAVPAHDERDYDFAKQYNLPIHAVIKPFDGEHDFSRSAYTEVGELINSEDFSGMNSKKAQAHIIEIYPHRLCVIIRRRELHRPKRIDWVASTDYSCCNIYFCIICFAFSSTHPYIGSIVNHIKRAKNFFFLCKIELRIFS